MKIAVLYALLAICPAAAQQRSLSPELIRSIEEKDPSSETFRKMASAEHMARAKKALKEMEAKPPTQLRMPFLHTAEVHLDGVARNSPEFQEARALSERVSEMRLHEAKAEFARGKLTTAERSVCRVSRSSKVHAAALALRQEILKRYRSEYPTAANSYVVCKNYELRP